jgi:ankyrin repeat protein
MMVQGSVILPIAIYPKRPSSPTYLPPKRLCSNLQNDTFLMDFQHALEKKDSIHLKALIEAADDLDSLLPNGHTPLTLAVTMDDLESVNLLLTFGADPNKCNKEGDLPIFLAIECKCSYLVRILCQNVMTNLSVVSSRFYNITILKKHLMVTPLFLAVAWQLEDIISILLEFNAQGDIKIDGITPLHLSARLKTIHVSKKLLVEGKANPNILDKDNNSPLYDIVEGSDDVDHFNLLAENKADPNLRCSEGETPFLRAVFHNRKMIIDRCVALKISADTLSHRGLSAYLIGLTHNHVPTRQQIVPLKTPFSEMWIEQKMLAHVCGVDNPVETEGLKIGLGSFYPEITTKYLLEFAKYYRASPRFGSVRDKLTKSELSNAWDWIIKTLEELNERQKKIAAGTLEPRSKHLEVINVGWFMHATAFASMSHCAKINRGEASGNKPGAVVYTISRYHKRLVSFQKMINLKGSSEGLKYFNETVNVDLGLVEMHHLKAKPHDTKTCSNATVKFIPRVILFLYMVDKKKWNYLDADAESLIIYKDFTLMYRDWMLNKYYAKVDEFYENNPQNNFIVPEFLSKLIFDSCLKDKYEKVIQTIVNRYPKFATADVLNKVRTAQQYKIVSIIEKIVLLNPT